MPGIAFASLDQLIDAVHYGDLRVLQAMLETHKLILSCDFKHIQLMLTECAICGHAHVLDWMERNGFLWYRSPYAKCVIDAAVWAQQRGLLQWVAEKYIETEISREEFRLYAFNGWAVEKDDDMREWLLTIGCDVTTIQQ